MIWVGHVACMVEMRNAYKILVVKPEGKNLLRRHRHKWENNIRKSLKGNRVGRCGLDMSGSG
jgi:hypothetical protein